jgi:hypothetical protein
MRLLSFDSFEFFEDILRDFWFCHTNGDDRDTGIILITGILKEKKDKLDKGGRNEIYVKITRYLDSAGKRLVQFIELIDVYLVERVAAAELVDFVMDFVENPNFIVIDSVITHSLKDVIAVQLF